MVGSDWCWTYFYLNLGLEIFENKNKIKKGGLNWTPFTFIPRLLQAIQASQPTKPTMFMQGLGELGGVGELKAHDDGNTKLQTHTTIAFLFVFPSQFSLFPSSFFHSSSYATSYTCAHENHHNSKLLSLPLSLFLCWWNDNCYYAPTTWKTTMGRKAFPPYLVASNEELEVGNLELQTLLVVVAIHCCCYQLLLLLKNKRRGEWKRGKRIKQKQNKGRPLWYKTRPFFKGVFFFFFFFKTLSLLPKVAPPTTFP